MNNPTQKSLSVKSLASALILVSLPMLAGCAQSPKRPPTLDTTAVATSDTGPGMPSDMVTMPARTNEYHLLTFAHEFLALSMEAQRKQASSLNRLISQKQPENDNNQSVLTTKLQLAMMYGLPGSHVRDAARAQILLDEIIASKQLDNEERVFASIVRDYLNEAGKSAQKIKEEQKRADTAQQKLDELQKKLDDLKNIEKTMVDRDQGVRK